jgi:hypothetical protein
VVEWTPELAQRLRPGEATCEIVGIRFHGRHVHVE